MFFKSKVIFVLLLLSFLAVSVCNVVGLIPTSTGKDATTVYADGIFLCGLSSDWNYALFASITRIPSMTFAFLLFALALFGLYKHAMERRLIHGGWSANLWMKLLMTQSTIYFAACVACDAIVIACAWTDNLTLIAFGASLTTLNIYLLAPRLLISFRSYHSRHSRIGSANSSLGLSSRSSIDRDIQLQSFGRDSRTSSVLKLPMGTWEAITG
ncbi:hypothetical protein CONPUDRAFT_84056 [Coniophora puteana RWD-64-598 SS2]|uniref:Uncharacterized protein n=1 Tax=Coniophora puteana (strain RWD-64-598) TaxID=741705 RepID=A0A5M3MEG9_CONPW|nr:uncharacterized protein CONPUDRAFT_84056 [Coniophora puteana RWD-64-598 SS2]EIW77618.1 hypothetical protein CONPUDRAFT_84056 [Coniophora puteana RWD-64-598 SS2]